MKIPTAPALAGIALAAILALAGCAPATTAEANSADIMFVQQMIPHHEQAVEMSDVLLAKEDVDADVASLAERIKAAQQPEIELMEEWLDDWGAADMPHDDMDHGGGMMTQDDLNALEAATGGEASALFLEQMIEHHEGAIVMAELEANAGENPEAVALAEKIVEDQTAEIAEMRDLLTGL